MNQKKTKLYATLGPACAQENMIKQMLELGLTGFRMNLSHTGLAGCKNLLHLVKQASQQSGIVPEILIDMQGPEMRIGTLPNPLECIAGNQVFLYDGQNLPAQISSDETCIPVTPQILHKFTAGQTVLLDDGKILLEVNELSPHAVIAAVKRGGNLNSRKSIAIEGLLSDLPPLTAADMENIALAGQYGVTGLMQPFVRNEEDLHQVRKAMSKAKVSLRLFAKIENMEGIKNLDTIIPNADEIIIARGDLGNAMPLWMLPAWQKKIGDLCKKRGKPFMVVTQMLSSMEQNPIPTRAEVSDIFHAVTDGASSVMVTGETAIGKYPVEVIRYLANTCREAETYLQSQ